MAGRGRGANPLAHVLQALGEDLDLLTYKNWNVLLPEGTFLTQVGADQFVDVLQQVRGPEAVAEWRRLQVRVGECSAAVLCREAKRAHLAHVQHEMSCARR